VSAEIILPKIDEAMVKGKIIEWKKSEGDRVEKGDIVFTIETEKVTWEVEAPESGILAQVRYHAGQEVMVGTIVAYVLQPGEQAPGKNVPVSEQGQKDERRKEPPSSPQRMTRETPGTEARVSSRKIKASPLAKKLARQGKIDLSAVPGTGPGGRILRRDIQRHAEQMDKTPAVAPVQGKEIPLSSMRETIARRMIESFQFVPHFYISVEADAEALNAAHRQLKPSLEKSAGLKLTLTDLLLKIIARALEEHSEINIQWTGNGIRQLTDCNIGLAIGLPNGLIVPVIRQANRRSLAELTQARSDLVARAQQGKVRMDEMRGGSMTLTNLGMFGIDQFDPILNPPESCILATGRILEKPVAHQGQVTIRKRMNLTLAIDHRVLDGVMGSRFLQRIKELIEQPILLL
jgi:pyruvate dehydrogenase E2 component (dihydrolipoamide acetyltransferase)